MTELRWLARTAMLRVRDMSRLALLLAVSVVISWIGRRLFNPNVGLVGGLAIPEPFGHAVAITLPWCVLLPFGIWAAVREADLEKARRVRLLLVWLATVFVIIAVSDQQRERYHLPLCPAVMITKTVASQTSSSRTQIGRAHV